MKTRAIMFLIAIALLAACSASQIPSVWLLTGDTMVQGTLGSYCWEGPGCVDAVAPQERSVATAELPPGTQATIAVDSTSVTQFSAHIQPWSSNFHPATAHRVAAEHTVEGNQTIFTLTPITDTNDTLLYVSIRVGEYGGADYSWHLNPAP